MRTRKQKLIIIACSACLALSAFAAPAHALIPITFSASAGEDGVTINYNIPLMLPGNVILREPGDSQEIRIALATVEIATIQLTLNSVTTSPPVVNLHYAGTSPYATIPEGDIPVPFGEIGAAVNIFGNFLNTLGDYDFEASLLLKANRAQYDIAANLPDMVVDSWKGEAVPGNNEIHEQVLYAGDGSVLADVNITLAWEMPLFTTVTYDITVTPPGAAETDIPLDNATTIPPLQGTIPVPNGSYHVWFNLNQ